MKEPVEWSERLVLLALHEAKGIGWRSIRKALASGSLVQCVHYAEAQWRELGLSGAQAASARSVLMHAEAAAASLERYARMGVRVITMLDDDYPELLRETHEPPWVLYAKGRVELLKTPALALVGTRTPSAYGRQATIRLARELAARGLTIVSGLAKGIDRCAHEGALTNGGATIAVLGTPIDIVYPAEHRALFACIAQQGLLVSEYPIGTRCHAGLFPQRNRIIAGLSVGTAVVEAAQRSGSLITVDHAITMNREVFAVPGPVQSRYSEGTHQLLKNGAKLLAEAEDVMEEFIHRPDILGRLQPSKSAPPPPETKLTGDEVRLLRLVREKPGTADELHERSGMPFGLLHAVLINLTIKRRIEQHPGFIYRAF
ncbi:DNA-protecting protein DprA [Paenibacillus sp. IB182496]|uniref:DNA-protecting protein DprA n=1 Tax=Paenibacillus sabuli TaxID=2772509 RepID=A0A927BT58_9BACL|nr:DNA-processing protein DprA [Paenibacillus sabuli]MBD2845300.1 DNA-protecting protein DprA [Paenibacillus sabuli]